MTGESRDLASVSLVPMRHTVRGLRTHESELLHLKAREASPEVPTFFSRKPCKRCKLTGGRSRGNSPWPAPESFELL